LEIEYAQHVIKLLLMPLAILTLAGCGSAVETDESPQAQLVATWLSSSQWGWWPASNPVVPGAVLTMSDFGQPLTLSTLRQSGPDRIAGCALARVKRASYGVTATWSCSSRVDLLQRQVEFDVRDGRIRGARYIEAYQAQSENVR
jgi:uncharacterized protein YceK